MACTGNKFGTRERAPGSVSCISVTLHEGARTRQGPGVGQTSERKRTGLYSVLPFAGTDRRGRRGLSGSRQTRIRQLYLCYSVRRRKESTRARSRIDFGAKAQRALFGAPLCWDRPKGQEGTLRIETDPGILLQATNNGFTLHRDKRKVSTSARHRGQSAEDTGFRSTSEGIRCDTETRRGCSEL